MSRSEARSRLPDRIDIMQTRFLVRVVVAVTLLAGGGAGLAYAQPDPPRVSIAGGVGMAKQTYGELTFDSSPAWDVSVRVRTARHLAIEGLFDQWRQAEHSVHLDQLLTGPNGPLGRVARIDERRTYRMGTLGINVLAIGNSGRVTVAGGGGVGFMAYDRTFSQGGSGCEPSVASACVGYSNSFSSSSLTAQGTGALDVAVVRHIAIVGRYDLIVPVQEPGFLHHTLTAGVRVAFP